MNDVIKELYEIEATASKIIENSQKQKQQMLEKIELEKQSFSKEVLAQKDEKITRLNLKLEEEGAQEIEKIVQRNEAEIRQLRDKYDGHLQKYAQEIVERITEV